jgi:hypothetical protein
MRMSESFSEIEIYGRLESKDSASLPKLVPSMSQKGQARHRSSCCCFAGRKVCSDFIVSTRRRTGKNGPFHMFTAGFPRCFL